MNKLSRRKKGGRNLKLKNQLKNKIYIMNYEKNRTEYNQADNNFTPYLIGTHIRKSSHKTIN